MTIPGGRPPRLLAVDDPGAEGLDAVRPGEVLREPQMAVRIESEDSATALAELAWAISVGAETVVVPELAAARDYLVVHAALHGWVEIDPELALAPELRREPPPPASTGTHG